MTGSADVETAHLTLDSLARQRIHWEQVFWCAIAIFALLLVGRVTRETAEDRVTLV